MRICYKCKVPKELSEFYSDKRDREGKQRQCKKCCKNYSEANIDKIKARKKVYQQNMPEHLRVSHRQYYQNNKEHFCKQRRDSYLINRPNLLSKNKRFIPNLKITDPERIIFNKLKCNLRSRISTIFKINNINKNISTEKLLGVDFNTVKLHIERQFKKGMTWENRGHKTWHIDHKIPLSSANTEEELKVLFHYTNLQPLWALENLKKGDRKIETQIILTL